MVSPRFHQTRNKTTRMKSIVSILTVLAAGTMFATAAEEKKEAAPGAKPEAGAPAKPHANPEEAFKKLDTNNDGSLSLDAFKAGKKDAAKAEEAFKKKDKDGDGKLSLEEFKGHEKKK